MTLANLYAGLLSKRKILKFLASRNTTDFLDLGNNLAVLLVGMMWIVVWNFWSDRIDYLLDSIEIFEERVGNINARKNGGMRQEIDTARNWVFLFEVISWTAAVFKTVFYEGFLDWTLDEFVLGSSEFTSELLFDWNVNINETDHWLTNYGQTYYCHHNYLRALWHFDVVFLYSLID